MSAFDWESFLRQWSQVILETMNEAEKQLLPPEVLNSQWLGYPGATKAEIDRAEARLKVKLPPSYRAFLQVSNGWRQTSSKTDNFNHRFWSTEDIEHFAVRHLQWIKAFTERTETVDIAFEEDFSELDDRWEPVGIPDEEYLVYGEQQDPSRIRPAYLRSAIEISDVGFDSIYLLNPQVVTPEGEWEVWFFADYYPGADRYRSFQAMMEAEYHNFLERQTSPEGSSMSASFPESPPRSSAVLAAPGDISASGAVAGLGESASEAPLTPLHEPAIVWLSLKRLSVELQGRSTVDQTEYRTIASTPELSLPQIWPGLAEQQLQQWIRQQLLATQQIPLPDSQTAIATSATTAPSETPPAELSESVEVRAASPLPKSEPKSVSIAEPPVQEVPPLRLSLDVTQLAISQPAHTAAQIVVRPTKQKQARQSWMGDLSSQQPFSIEVAIHLASQPTDHPALSKVFYKTQVFAQNRVNHHWIELGESAVQSLTRDRSTYTTFLFSKTLDSGMYRLQIITSLSGAAKALNSFELPLLNVV